MNKEVYHEGWLIKSPPTKRIWRARWRRRWFTLKQGEIPGQFCLEYYTDRNCRKLKGTIDLDQCEQVDCGLRLEHRKQKFQNMFDVKTPRRTFYLAADSEADMHDWVNCICQVCNLQDLTKQPNDRQYYNIGADAQLNKPNESDNNTASLQTNSTNTTTTTTTDHDSSKTSLEAPTIDSTYQNDDFAYRSSIYTNRETIMCDAKYPATAMPQTAAKPTAVANVVVDPKTDYYNFAAFANEASKHQIERSNSMRLATTNTADQLNMGPISNHFRTMSLVEHHKPAALGASRKIPENLNLTEQQFVDNNAEPSPALSTCSGPYIPISECFSGSPLLLDNANPSTPLNSLDPRFYDTPRSHINIGLNLTNDQPYSPKRNNFIPTRPQGGRSSPSDSESVFTDDEDWTHPTVPTNQKDRNLRPSDSSAENDSFVFTYTHRFSKMPDENGKDASASEPNTNCDNVVTANSNSTTTVDAVKEVGKTSKRVSTLHLENIEERNKDTLSSDTENASPAIGPKDVSCCVEDSYDIPRSHHLPYYNLKNRSPTELKDEELLATSTPNLMSDTLTRKSQNRSHFYSNAAPSKVDGNVFRYDFVEQENAPVVNRGLKPKHQADEKATFETGDTVKALRQQSTSSHIDIRPPCIDRKLKPSVPKFDTKSLRRNGGPMSMSLSSDSEFMANHAEFLSKTLPRNYNNSAMAAASAAFANHQKPIGHLEYFELDHSNPPSICQNALVGPSSMQSSSITNLSNFVRLLPPPPPPQSAKSTVDIFHKVTGIMVEPDQSGIVYKSVDFIKTEAIKRTRQDRAQNHSLLE